MSIRKRSWAAPDGTPRTAWLVDYRDPAGKRRFKQFTRKKDAEAWSVNAAAEVQRGVHTADRASITVAQAAELWLAKVKADGREPTTIAAYDQQVRLHIVPRCGATKLSQLTAPGVRTLLDGWQADLSRPMATRVLRTFKAIIAHAQERGKVAQNAAQAITLRKAARERGKVQPPSKAHLRAILKASAESDDPKVRALFELAIFSGMRASELRGLAWPAIDLKGGFVEVEQRADARGMIGAPKSHAGRRRIPLPSRAIAALKAWKLACPPHPAGLVFPSVKGKPISHHTLTTTLTGPLQVKAKIDPPYTLHTFRHAAASLWIEQGLDPKRIQTLMGHSSIQVTFDTYGHLFADTEKERQDADAIERALFADAT